jgi:hypothetical protein
LLWVGWTSFASASHGNMLSASQNNIGNLYYRISHSSPNWSSYPVYSELFRALIASVCQFLYCRKGYPSSSTSFYLLLPSAPGRVLSSLPPKTSWQLLVFIPLCCLSIACITSLGHLYPPLVTHSTIHLTFLHLFS